jgi:predicted glycogen debranching enzyme
MEWDCEKSVTGAQVDIHLPTGATLCLASSTGIFNVINDWFYNMGYPQDRLRGQDWVEHHYLPGFWEMEPDSTGEFAISMSLQGPRVDHYQDLHQSELERQKKVAAPLKIVKRASTELARAADAFIVEKGGMPAIIAGYPWFDEWGRDTMIALPGLLLVTGRWDEARRILEKFVRYEKNGLLPNLIPEEGEPLYNTVDASLWYFQAVKKYLDYTNDTFFVQDTIYPVLKKIIQHYISGTNFGIVMDEDGLITAGTPGQQLTWMDAKVGDWVVTPRHGKTVEVNALWYNALYFMTLLAGCCNDKASQEFYGELALRVQEKFSPTFWSVRHDYLSDLVNGGERDERLRPNQVLALSLPYRLLSEKQEKLVLEAIDRHLFTPYGLRTLAPYENDYKPRYEGDLVSRDAAYHQGTAWAWLMGPYITAYRRTHRYSRQSRRAAAGILAPLFHHLQNHGLASVAEIFDGDHPYTPRGCPFQAWSVAELLRACVEEVQEKKPESTNWVLG